MYTEAVQESIANLQSPVRPLRLRPKWPREKQRLKLSEQPTADDSFVNFFIEFYPERAGASTEMQRERVTDLTRRIERWTYDTGRGAVAEGVLPPRSIVTPLPAVARG